jgi:hypothetical protein
MRGCRTTLIALVALLCCGFLDPFLPRPLARDQAKDLPEELRHMQISDRPVRSDAPEVGEVVSIEGWAGLVILHKKQGAAYWGREKDPVFQEDAVYSLKDSRARLEFRDKSVTMLSPESRLDISEVVLSLLEGEKRASFELLKGKAIFYALPLFGYRETKLQVKTPTAMIGVRGTKFGVEVGARQGRQDVVTRVYVFDGAVDVTGLADGRKQTLRQNETVEADGRGLGEVRLDPEKTRSFLEEVAGGTGSVTRPGRTRQILEQRYQKDEMDRFDQLQDIKQREITPPVSPHPGPSH